MSKKSKSKIVRMVASAAILLLLQNVALALSCDLQCLTQNHHQHMHETMTGPSTSSHMVHGHHGNSSNRTDASARPAMMSPSVVFSSQVQTCEPMLSVGPRFKAENNKGSDVSSEIASCVQTEQEPLSHFPASFLTEVQPPGSPAPFRLSLRI